MPNFPLAKLSRVLRGARVGLAATPASRVAPGVAVEAFLLAEGCLSCFLALEHGLRGELQDGVEFADGLDARTGLPVFSFYGAAKTVPSAFFAGIDVAVFCVQDVSHRAYTFKQSLAELLQGAARHGVKVVVVDRPTPLAHLGSSGPLHPQFFPVALPVVIPYTLGELGRLLAREKSLDLDLEVLRFEGWQRSSGWPDEFPWIPPSPNIPTLDSAYAYAVAGLIQATNISEGRGTCKPFEYIGAPFVEPAALQSALAAWDLPGIEWRGTYFKPGFGKYAHEVCGGVQLMIRNRRILNPVRTSMVLLRELALTAPGRFTPLPGLEKWLDGKIRSAADFRALEVDETSRRWEDESAAFDAKMAGHAIYGAATP